MTFFPHFHGILFVYRQLVSEIFVTFFLSQILLVFKHTGLLIKIEIFFFVSFNMMMMMMIMIINGFVCWCIPFYDDQCGLFIVFVYVCVCKCIFYLDYRILIFFCNENEKTNKQKHFGTNTFHSWSLSPALRFGVWPV